MKNNTRFAGLWPRFLALFIDFLLFCVIFFPVTRLLKGTWLLSTTDHHWNYGIFITDPLCMVFLIVMFLYFVFLEGLVGVTLGKWIAGLRVVQVGGGKPGLIKSLLRNALRIVDGLPAFNILGILLILNSKEKTRYGDRIAGTRVIKVKKL